MDNTAEDFLASPSKRQKISDDNTFADTQSKEALQLAEAPKESVDHAESTAVGSIGLPAAISHISTSNAPFVIPGLGAGAAVARMEVEEELEPDHIMQDSSPSTAKSNKVDHPAQESNGELAETKQIENDGVNEAMVDIKPQGTKETRQTAESEIVTPLLQTEDERTEPKDTDLISSENRSMITKVVAETVPSLAQEDQPLEFEFEEDDEVASHFSVGKAAADDSMSSVDDDSESDDSSSDEGDETDDEDEYSLLDPAEQAKRLMAGESDDSGGGPAKALRTKNEKVEEAPPKPNITITPDMEILSLGPVQSIVENVVLIQAKISGIDEALDVGTVLCLGDRKLVGVIADIFGKTDKPYYTMRFAKDEDIKEEGISVGIEVFFVPQHAKYVQTRPLRYMKGTDASKDNDEPGANDEFEFSDDEKEREHKLMKRAARRQNGGTERDGMNGGFNRGNRGPRGRGRAGRGQWRGRGGHDSHPLPKLQGFADSNPVLSYDDAPSDEIYRRLTRPGTAQSQDNDAGNPNTYQQNGSYSPPQQNEFGHRGGRGNGFRGRGRGRGDNAGSHNQSHSPHANSDNQPMQFSPTGYAPPFQSPTATPYPYQMPQNGYANNNNMYAYGAMNPGYQAPNPYQNFAQPQYPNFGQQPGPTNGFSAPPQQYSGNNAMPFIPPGSHVNPEFFRRQSQGPPPPGP